MDDEKKECWALRRERVRFHYSQVYPTREAALHVLDGPESFTCWCHPEILCAVCALDTSCTCAVRESVVVSHNEDRAS